MNFKKFFKKKEYDTELIFNEMNRRIMSIAGMYMLNAEQYNQEKIYQALDILYVDRKNQFRELSQVILSEKTVRNMPRWKEFILNFCFRCRKIIQSMDRRRSTINEFATKSSYIVKTIRK